MKKVDFKLVMIVVMGYAWVCFVLGLLMSIFWRCTVNLPEKIILAFAAIGIVLALIGNLYSIYKIETKE